MEKRVPTIGRRRPAELRFWEHVGDTDANGCWPWVGARTDGYGHLSVPIGQNTTGWRMVLAHRFLFEIYYGLVPAGLELDHLCRNRACVNPFHLEAVTRRVNALRGISFAAINSRKTHCSKGHPFDGDNLKLYRTKTGQVRRRCRICANAAVARHRRNVRVEKTPASDCAPGHLQPRKKKEKK